MEWDVYYAAMIYFKVGHYSRKYEGCVRIEADTYGTASRKARAQLRRKAWSDHRGSGVLESLETGRHPVDLGH